jgi:hypothetical protein
LTLASGRITVLAPEGHREHSIRRQLFAWNVGFVGKRPPKSPLSTSIRLIILGSRKSLTRRPAPLKSVTAELTVLNTGSPSTSASLYTVSAAYPLSYRNTSMTVLQTIYWQPTPP